MSQFQNPYPGQYPQPPPPGSPMNYAGATMYGDPLVPAKRASLAMFIRGSLGILCGAGLGVVASVNIAQLAAQSGQPLPPLPPGVTWATLQRVLGWAAAGILVASVLQIIIGVFVRRGGAGAAIAGIVL